MNWHKREEHDGLFADGDTVLVATPVRTKYRGERTKKWEVDLVVFRIYNEDEGEGSFVLVYDESEEWAWTWDDVEYWIAEEELTKDLPNVEEIKWYDE